ncbi:MAG TPA: nuclear transport factor 2 family protein [Ilumatobacteraceae bacterium]|nr:nuclear transport factor 2 family protein [Ilumatobacteraceae bacterium]
MATAPHPAGNPTESAAAALCRSYLAAFATGNADLVVAHVTHDFVNDHTAALGHSFTGRDEYTRRVPGFLASMPELRYDVEHVTAEGDSVWAAYTMRARVNDRDIALRGAMHFVVRDDLIASRTDYWDSAVFQHQAGLGNE